MKTNKPRRSSIREIHSMHDLQLEKARLNIELLKTEDKIKSNYRHILSAFSLRNIFTTVTTELTNSNSILAKAVTIGKNWLGRRKKKKKEKESKNKVERSMRKHVDDGRATFARELQTALKAEIQ